MARWVKFAEGSGQISATTYPISFTKVVGGGAYTPRPGDPLILDISSSRNIAPPAAAPTTPTGWIVVAAQTHTNSTNSVASTTLVRIADGTSLDTPTITQAGQSTQWVADVILGIETSAFPFDPASLPEAGNQSTLTTGNPGFSLTTRADDLLLRTLFAARAPVGMSGFAWSGNTADFPLTNFQTNNYIATAMSEIGANGVYTPSATWSGGATTASIISSLAFKLAGETPPIISQYGGYF